MPPSITITRPLPNGVTYSLATPHRITITLPPGSVWSSGLHWHETHTEYLCVLQGAISVRLGDTTRTISAHDGEVEIPRGVWHEWRRATTDDGEEVVLVERTDPEDCEKALFFWNLNGVVLGAGDVVQVKPKGMPAWVWGWVVEAWVTLNLFVIFRELDNVPVMLDVEALLARFGIGFASGTRLGGVLVKTEVAWSHLVLGIASMIGWTVGVEAVRPAFTPDKEYRAWIGKRGKGKSKST